MPYREPDPEDPHELVGVSIPGDADSMREMAATFAEEFATLGFSEDRLLRLFRNPGYAGAHRAYEVLGELEIRRIIRESLELWGRFRFVVRDTDAAHRNGSSATLVQIGSGSERAESQQDEEVD